MILRKPAEAAIVPRECPAYVRRVVREAPQRARSVWSPTAKTGRPLQLLPNLKHNRALRKAPNHAERARSEIRFMEVWIVAAIGRTLLVHRAAIVRQESTGALAHHPGVVCCAVGPGQILCCEFGTAYPKVCGQALDLAFAQRRRHLAATVGAGSAVNLLPDPLRYFKYQPVHLFRSEPRAVLQEVPELVIPRGPSFRHPPQISRMRCHMLPYSVISAPEQATPSRYSPPPPRRAVLPD